MQAVNNCCRNNACRNSTLYPKLLCKHFVNISITDSGQVGHKIIFNILVQPELIQTCFKQVNNVNYCCRRLAACYACVSGATLCSISSTSTHCCSTLQCYSQTWFSERDSSVYGRVWSHRPTCRPCCWSLIRSDALLTRYRSTTVQSALSSHCPGCRSTTADCKTCAPSV